MWTERAGSIRAFVGVAVLVFSDIPDTAVTSRELFGISREVGAGA